MNKTELIDAVAEAADLTKAESSRAVDAVVAAITKALKDGDAVTLVGFGTFRSATVLPAPAATRRPATPSRSLLRRIRRSRLARL